MSIVGAVINDIGGNDFREDLVQDAALFSLENPGQGQQWAALRSHLLRQLHSYCNTVAVPYTQSARWRKSTNETESHVEAVEFNHENYRDSESNQFARLGVEYSF